MATKKKASPTTSTVGKTIKLTPDEWDTLDIMAAAVADTAHGLAVDAIRKLIAPYNNPRARKDLQEHAAKTGQQIAKLRKGMGLTAAAKHFQLAGSTGSDGGQQTIFDENALRGMGEVVDLRTYQGIHGDRNHLGSLPTEVASAEAALPVRPRRTYGRPNALLTASPHLEGSNGDSAAVTAGSPGKKPRRKARRSNGEAA